MALTKPLVQDNIAELLLVFRNYLRTELLAFGNSMSGVELANIADINESRLNSNGIEISLKDRVIITLVRAEEDPTRRNQLNHRKNPADNSLFYRNPPVGLNLYLLLTASHGDYVVALRVLSRIAAILQRQVALPAGDPAWDGVEALFEERRLKLSLVSQTFEQQNHLWSMLGGRQRPSLLYMAQTASIEYVPVDDFPGSPITTIELNETLR